MIMNMEKEDSNNLKALRDSVDKILDIIAKTEENACKDFRRCRSWCRYSKCFRHYGHIKTMVWMLICFFKL